MNHIRFLYLRDSKNFPIVCVSYLIDRDDGKATYGISTFNPDDKKVQYERKFLREVAAGRLILDRKNVAFPKDANLHTVIACIVSALSEDNNLPKRTRKAVVAWLKNDELPRPNAEVSNPTLQ